MLNGRKRYITALTGLVLAGAVGLSPSTPAQAEPDVGDVQARVDTLFHQAEVASERFNDARLDLKALHQDLSSLKADQSRQRTKVRQVQRQVQDSVVQQYEGQNLSAVGQVVVSDDPNAFLSGLTTMASFNDLQSELFDDYSTQLKALGIREDATSNRVDSMARTEKQMASEKATVDDKLSQAKSLLERLQADQREAIVSRDNVRMSTDETATAPATDPATAPATDPVSAPATAPASAPAPVSGRASAAVAYALAQVGKTYVYGAAGPNTFDCSGLTMMAWAQAGVSLPHSSVAQYSSGTHIAESDLQPGDLVFYYSPISHVGIYIGNGLAVNALNPGAGVAVNSLHMMPYVGAVRPG